jgi:hypothetical protein
MQTKTTILKKDTVVVFSNEYNNFIGEIQFIEIIDGVAKILVQNPEGRSDFAEVSELSIWTPDKGKWYWFYDWDYTPVFGQLLETITEDDEYIASIPNGKGTLETSTFQECKPFFGKLPKQIEVKDNQ